MTVQLTEAQKKKLSNGLCVTKFCIKPKAKKGHYCHSCVKRKYKAAHPLEYTYTTWLINCRRRKKINTVTFEQFKFFVGDTDYMRKKGTGAKKFTIDRKKECGPDCPKEWCYEHGYHFHTIQSITLSANSKKWHRSRKQDFSQVPF
jgi:hypothetical protein